VGEDYPGAVEIQVGEDYPGAVEIQVEEPTQFPHLLDYWDHMEQLN
jgi:hypothetical protein